MIQLNKKKDEENLSSAETWSIRNLENLLNRMAEQQKCNNDIIYKNMKFENCEIYHNILFYVLSYIEFESINECFDPVLKIISECFELDQEKANQLYYTYYNIPEISYDNNSNFLVLRKNNSKIFFKNERIKKNYEILNKIPSLINTLFNCLLCADTEPILLIGPTSYKNYLVKLLLKNVKIITLNEESSIDALLGSTGFFTREELKIFYLSLICNVCFINKKNELLQNLKEGKLNIKTLEKDIKNFFKIDDPRCGERIVFKK